ncbi:MAG TPA: CocE/NonD family hydrolase, partial [Paludibacteraceae bacterium]|nr:CocE/NonD family hydrolase [Paludibacteraceae bacterium]
MKKQIVFIFALFVSAVLFSQSPEGSWNGLLKVQGQQIRLVINIQQAENGYKATMDSPDQGAKGIPVDLVTFTNDTLKFEVKMIGVTYTGVLGEDKVIKGTFAQMGMSLPLDLTTTKIEKEKVLRPQEPKAPFPYLSEDVKFINSIDGDTLAGTLTMPKKEGKYPVVVLISGSGAQNRDEELMGHKPFLVIADFLTRNGIAVLRYDDRGTAQSTGDFQKANSTGLANDAEAAVSYLLTRKEINKKKIGLAGHSEGGIIAPMVAARNRKVAFIV